MVVPLQVVLQARPPDKLKGRMIGTMNLINWIAILAGAGFYHGCNTLLQSYDLPPSYVFAATGMLLVPVAMFYRPKDTAL
jgi:hypothetical protein